MSSKDKKEKKEKEKEQKESLTALSKRREAERKEFFEDFKSFENEQQTKIQQEREEEWKRLEEEEMRRKELQEQRRKELEEEQRKQKQQDEEARKLLEEEERKRMEQFEKLQIEETRRCREEEEMEEKRKQQEQTVQQQQRQRQMEMQLKSKEEEYKQMHGYLRKQGHVVKSWKIRFFSVSFHDRHLNYYEDSTNKEQLGSFPLNNCAVQICDLPVDGNHHCFKIHCNDKVLLLSASSPDERKTWVDAIRFVSAGVLEDVVVFEEENVNRKAKAMIKLKGNRIAKSGWLEKEGHVFRSWRKRWFVLSNTRGTTSMSYYSDNLGVYKKGDVYLRRCTVQKTNDVKGKLHCLILRTTTPENELKDFLVSCESAEECDLWMDAVLATVNAIEQEALAADYLFK